MDQFIEEVDEDLRRDRQKALWNRYGRWLVAAALVVVIAIAASVGWRHYQENRRIDAGLSYAEAVALAEAGRGDEAARILAGLARSGYGVMARFQEANLVLQAGDRDAAAEIYDRLSRQSSVPGALRDLALILHGYAGLDAADPEALKARLAPLTVGPWRYSAQELIALLEHRRGDVAAARSLFQSLVADPETPSGLRERAGLFLEELGGQGPR